MLFQISSRSSPFTMLVVAMAPGLTSGFISGPPSTFCDSSIETMELKRMPVASVPIVLVTISGPLCSNTLAMVKTFEIDSIATSDSTSPAV
jgi:hypothetical protein